MQGVLARTVADMRVFLTGGTGFIGQRLAKRLRDRGDEVSALVRQESQAGAALLKGLGCDIIEGDLNDRMAVERGVECVDSVFHIAGSFEIGVAKADCPKMQDVNIGGVRRVVDAAMAAGVKRIVHASSVTIFGNTKGEVVDESHTRDVATGYLSCYDESKTSAHALAMSRVAKGAPIVLVAPGAVFGPDDHSEVGREILMAARGEVPAVMLADVGINLVYVDDVVEGVLLAHDKGEVGETYVLGGENITLRDAMEQAATMAGRTLTKRTVPVGVLKTVAPIAPWFMKRMGYPPNLGELVRSADGVTFWAKSDKAVEKLGFSSRPFKDGLSQTLKAEGVQLVVS